MIRSCETPDPPPLVGRAALVTGGAGAIGQGIALRLAAAGARVAVADLDRAGAASVAREVAARYGKKAAVAVRMDVTREPSVAAGIAAVLRAFGRLDVVVSNAGIAKSAPIDELDLADWERSFAVNARGHFLVAKHALIRLKRARRGGSFVFIASKNVPAPGKDFAAYSAAKAAETQLARVLAIEAAPFGIRVNILHPDGIFDGSGLWSPETRRKRAKAWGIPVAKVEEHYRKRNLLQVKVTAEDVAEAVLFFASDASSKITGAQLPVDGGLREAFPR